jgi:hypothetical protein
VRAGLVHRGAGLAEPGTCETTSVETSFLAPQASDRGKP